MMLEETTFDIPNVQTMIQNLNVSNIAYCMYTITLALLSLSISKILDLQDFNLKENILYQNQNPSYIITDVQFVVFFAHSKISIALYGYILECTRILMHHLDNR